MLTGSVPVRCNAHSCSSLKQDWKRPVGSINGARRCRVQADHSSAARHQSSSIRCHRTRRQHPQRSTIIASAGKGEDSLQQNDPTRTALSIGLGALWVGILGYIFMFSPNQTPFRDQIFLEKLVGLGSNEGIQINRVFFALFNLMGVYPAIYAALLNPAARSSNKVPLAPFLALSFGAGVFALLPYFALWAPLPVQQRQLPPKSELGPIRKALESKITAGVLLAAATGLLISAVTAGSEEWTQFFYLFDESRFVHVTSLDFLLLTAFLPFWLSNDASFRKWSYQDSALFLGFIPLIGPAIYLLLRPRSE